MMGLLRRYLDGECEAVWRELAQLSVSPDEVRAIARETMERVRRNAERLVERLRKIGYVFDVYSDGEPIRHDWVPTLIQQGGPSRPGCGP